MAERVIVYLDWQNVYMRAREAFHSSHDPYFKGQVDPIDLGELLASRGKDADRDLVQVRIYRGTPDQRFDARGYAAARRQMAAWTRNRKVEIITTTLRYPDGWPNSTEHPREKGIDVSLAVDLVVMGTAGEYDTAIVMSSDQDIAPAVEYIAGTSGIPARVEVAAWRGKMGRRPNRINTRARVYGHWLTDQDYWGLVDETDYMVASTPPTAPVPRPPTRY
ncbi:hypothetical protein CH252_05870 [Rhodococcus sp. 06-1477-1B]|nr:hypothetical protein CH252_05870 [Rhodococcus sp. 06-1477-1B]